jgi:hypothetical protein
LKHRFESLKQESRGRLISTALSAAWRSFAAPPSLSTDELAEIAPFLIQSGAGALVWRRIRNSALASSEAGAQLQQAYRLHRLEAGIHLQKIKRVLTYLHAAGIEPVLVKGWSVARLYPESGLRHFLDVDLCVRSDQHAIAQRLLVGLGDEGLYVDLHKELDHLDAMPWDEFWARTHLLTLDDTTVRVPCAEDHLRILCLHWLRHGAWKPAGLCDIGAMFESRCEEFDWQRCLGSDPVRAVWVACTIGLAMELLGAENGGQGSEVRGQRSENREQRSEAREPWLEVGGQRLEKRAKAGSGEILFALRAPREAEDALFSLHASPFRLPRWLVPAILRQWSRSQSPNACYPALTALLHHTSSWKETFDDIYSRLDQPVRATVALHGRFNDWPRWPYQLGELVLHSSEVPKQLALMIREFVKPRSGRDMGTGREVSGKKTPAIAVP